MLSKIRRVAHAIAWIAACAMAATAQAKPIAFAHGTTVMGEYGAGTMTEVQAFYAPTFRYSLGVSHLTWRRARADEGAEMNSAHNRNVGIAATALLASSATLVCCVLPAVLVSLGAGAALVGLVTAVPQLIWLSEHKVLVFGIAAALLVLSGITLWNARRLPCPIDAQLARNCMRLRAISNRLWAVAAIAYAAEVGFAFLLPALA